MAQRGISDSLSTLISYVSRQYQGLQQSRQAFDRASNRLMHMQAQMVRAPLQVAAAQAGLTTAQQEYAAAPTPANMVLLQEARAALLDARAHLQEVRAGFAQATQAQQLARQQFTLAQQGLSGLTAASGAGIATAGLGGIAHALAGNQFGQVASGLGMGMATSGLLLGVTNPVGAAIAAVGAFGVALGMATQKLGEWGDQLLRESFQFAQFSASMAYAQAAFQRDQMLLSRERGERQAGSARELAEARMQLAQATAPWEDMWANLKNELVAPAMKLLAKIVDDLTQIARGLGIMAKKEDNVEFNRAMNEFMRGVGAGNLIGAFGRPERFGGDQGRNFDAAGADF